MVFGKDSNGAYCPICGGAASLLYAPYDSIACQRRMVKREKERIGDKIKESRTQLGWGQKETAIKLGLGQSEVSQFEQGYSNRSLSSYQRVADLVGAFLPRVPDVASDAPDDGTSSEAEMEPLARGVAWGRRRTSRRR